MERRPFGQPYWFAIGKGGEKGKCVSGGIFHEQGYAIENDATFYFFLLKEGVLNYFLRVFFHLEVFQKPLMVGFCDSRRLGLPWGGEGKKRGRLDFSPQKVIYLLCCFLWRKNAQIWFDYFSVNDVLRM